MKYHEVEKLIDSFMKNVRLNDTKEAKNILKKLLRVDCKIDKHIARKIYELGEIFFIFEANPYIILINKVLEKRNNLFLRLIRQEIMYNSNEYDSEELFKINKIDLEKFPNNSHLLNFRGLIYFDNEKYEKALKYINQALSYEKRNVDFMRNKATVLMYLEEYNEAHKVIEYARGLEPWYEKLKETQGEIDRKVEQDEIEINFSSIKSEIKKLKDIKLEFMQVAALFVVILTIVVRVVTFDYKNFENLSFLDILFYQIAINFSWIFALFLIIALIIILHIKRK